MVMLVPLMILAVLSLVGGWVGIRRALRAFLAPVFGAGARRRSQPKASSQQHASIMLMAISPWLRRRRWACISPTCCIYKRPELPQKIADTLGGLYQAGLHKYYVDEIYATLFVKPLVDGSTRILWQGVDQGVIDGAVNDAADARSTYRMQLRHMQSGNMRSYAGWIAPAARSVIAYMIWMGVR